MTTGKKGLVSTTGDFDLNRMKTALESGEPIRLPKGLTREEKREYLMGVRDYANVDLSEELKNTKFK